MFVLRIWVIDCDRARLRLRGALLAAGLLGLCGEIWAVNLRPVLDTWSDGDGGVALVVDRVDRLQARHLRSASLVGAVKVVAVGGHIGGLHVTRRRRRKSKI